MKKRKEENMNQTKQLIISQVYSKYLKDQKRRDSMMNWVTALITIGLIAWIILTIRGRYFQ